MLFDSLLNLFGTEGLALKARGQHIENIAEHMIHGNGIHTPMQVELQLFETTRYRAHHLQMQIRRELYYFFDAGEKSLHNSNNSK